MGSLRLLRRIQFFIVLHLSEYFSVTVYDYPALNFCPRKDSNVTIPQPIGTLYGFMPLRATVSGSVPPLRLVGPTGYGSSPSHHTHANSISKNQLVVSFENRGIHFRSIFSHCIIGLSRVYICNFLPSTPPECNETGLPLSR